MKPTYKTGKKYKCPYCDYHNTRTNLIDHVNKEHEDLIPEGYTAARAVYDFINGKNYGICMICKQKVYTWNDKINRYNNLCDNPKCRAEVRRIALERHIKVYNKPTLLGDPEQQEKMLANRKISGTYTFSDGGKITYTGKYEKNALEFMDTVLNIPSKDIQAPGPVLEYEYNGETHKWITDIYYIPANLLIEIKDGGSNPNKRSMPIYREKQLAKEEMITNLGTFNYIRLTNNDFSQLLAIFAEIKDEALTNENPKAMIRVNEEFNIGGAMPRADATDVCITPYMSSNTFDIGYAYSDSTEPDKVYIPEEDGDKIIINQYSKDDMNNDKIAKAFNNFMECFNHNAPKIAKVFETIYYCGVDASNKVAEKRKHIHEQIEGKKPVENKWSLINTLTGANINNYKDLFALECFRYYDKEREQKIHSYIENAYNYIAKDDNYMQNVIKTKGCVMICRALDGYYACTNDKFYMASEKFDTLEDLELSGVIDTMNDIYNANSNKKEDEENANK